MITRRVIFTVLLAIACSASDMVGEEKAADRARKALSLQEFVSLAAGRDTEFEAILMDELSLKYADALALPARDLVLSLTQQFHSYLGQDRGAAGSSVELSKLFPRSGTEISADYSASPSFSSDTVGAASLSVTQPIARNAFGRSTRLLEKIVGLEVDIAQHQVVEAYEDYLATIIVAYHAWYQAYENLAVARSSYGENEKLLDNIKKRARKQVAKDIDVNKIRLQILAKKERLIEMEEEYEKSLEIIHRIVRHDRKSELVPTDSEVPVAMPDDFRATFQQFTSLSRTFRVLRILKSKSALEVDKEADDLLPSINLVLAGELRGDDYSLGERDDMLYAGIAMAWPFPSQVDRAEHKVSKINDRKSALELDNARYRLYADLKGLYHEIRKESRLQEVADKKIELAEAVLEEETENYSFGRVTLNDYIIAVNRLDSNRFNRIVHRVRYRRLMTEWLRLTDRLVTARDAKWKTRSR